MQAKDFNDTYYPTPEKLADKMLAKIVGNPQTVLEPSAGKGYLVERINDRMKYRHSHAPDISCIEIDRDLRAILREKKNKVIDSDFLAFSGPDKFDLIIANPPFDKGAEHLLKAIDILYSGQIIFLLNAETIKNPHTNTRILLAKELKRLNAEIEFLPGEFLDAERKTAVEIALVNIIVERRVENDLFAGAEDKAAGYDAQVKENHQLSTGKNMADMVAEYNQIIGIATETIVDYYRNYRRIGKYIGLNREASRCHSSSYNDTNTAAKLTNQVQAAVNTTIREIRKDFWLRTLELKEVKIRLTAKLRSQFEANIQERTVMDFTEDNIRSFILNLIHGYNDTLTDAVLEIFDRFTIKHCWDDGFFSENIHYFDGWKTNKAFKVGKKVIIPIRGSYNGPFRDYGGWSLDYHARNIIADIDIVMNYFDGKSEYLSIVDALDSAFKKGENRNIESEYFKVTAFKKGTLHLTFTNEDILRRFNVAACLGKGWLPFDYGNKMYNDMQEDEKEVVKAFEGKKSYEQNLGRKLFENSAPNLPLLMAA